MNLMVKMERRLAHVWTSTGRIAALVGLCLFAAVGFPAESITITARPRYPWNGKVDLKFTIDGTSGTKYDTSFTAKDLVGNTNLTLKTLYKSDGTSANAAKEQLLPGTYNWVWNATTDCGSGFVCERVQVEGKTVIYDSLYMVIDLSGGASAATYPISYLDAMPSGGWPDEYKKSKMVLRRIPNGSVDGITISKPFYCCVFEITQKQYALVTGANPSFFSGDTRPVESVSYNMIRGSDLGAGWPSSNAVDADSFLGKLRGRTKNNSFDLPTEAQWEYACRAGTTSTFNNGGSKESDLKLLGCYGPDGTAKVGSYLPNAWGLYDMHGNVFEWCLDWWIGGYWLSVSGTDPVGPLSGSWRVARGGSHSCSSYTFCGSDYRHYSSPGSSYHTAGGDAGFRIVCGTKP